MPAEVHKDLHRTALPVQDIGRAGTIQVGKADMGRVEFAGKLEFAKVDRLTESSASQVWPAAHTLRADAYQVLLPRAQQITERHQIVAFVADHRQGCFTWLASHLQRAVEPAALLIGIQAHATRADHRQIGQATAHQAGQLRLRAEKLAGEGRERCEVPPLPMAVQGEKPRKCRLGQQPVELAVASDICKRLDRG